MQSRILIIVNASQKGLLCSLVQPLEGLGFDVRFVARDPAVKKSIQKILPEFPEDRVYVKSGFRCPGQNMDVLSECRKREEKYGLTFALLCAKDRALGKGYIFNVDRHPDIIKAWWPKEKKYRYLLTEFMFWENIITEISPTAVLGFGIEHVLSVVADHHDVLHAGIDSARYENRYLWVDTMYFENSLLAKKMSEYLRNFNDEDLRRDVVYKQNLIAQSVFRQLNTGYGYAAGAAAKRIVWETLNRLRGLYKRESYRFLGWVPSILRTPRNYRLLKKHGRMPEDLKDQPIVFFPLHFEPESSLLILSPEMNNSMEAISWISKNLPAGGTVVVKEHPTCLGVRSRRYYQNFLKMPNVVLSKPDVSSYAWIEKSDLVATITGTAGFEAVYFGKPVLSFGRHQIINHLPTVRYAESFTGTSAALQELLHVKASNLFALSLSALHRVLMENSIELDGFEKTYASEQQHPEMAEKLIGNLLEQFETPYFLAHSPT